VQDVRRRGLVLYRRSAVHVNATDSIIDVLLGVLTTVLLILLTIALRPEPADAATCTESLQAKIDAATSGGTVVANPCIYRQQITINKPIILRGQPGSEIRGSDIWTSWTYSGGYWRSGKTLPSFSQSTVECMPNTSRCLWPEQVFFDGKPLVQVASGTNPASGQFKVNSSRQVILKDNPTGHAVEVSVRRQWIVGNADNVTIEGFTMKHAANARGPLGAIANGNHSGWTIQNNILSDTHGAIVRMSDRGFKLLNNRIYRAGQIGVHATGDNFLVQGNKVYDNNTERFSYRWEAGGMKFIGNTGTVVNNNTVYNNGGNAIHFDGLCLNNTISNNRVHHNARKGIQYEISLGGEIFDNVLWENGWATPEGNDGAGITLHNASNTEVYRNTLAWHPDGIAVFGLKRLDHTDYNRVHDVYVHDNTILGKNSVDNAKNHVALGWFQGWSTQLFDPINNNRGVNNRYWYTTSESNLARYVWNSTNYSAIRSFNLTRGEEGGRYLTQTEKNSVVANKGIPASPEPH
jgi:parallel beta-helix repeat protein